jgi:hypothetical protein
VPAGVVAISWLSFVVMFCCRVGARWRDRVLCVHRPSRAARFLHDAAIGGFQSIGIVTGLTTHSTRPLPAVAVPAASRGALIQTLGVEDEVFEDSCGFCSSDRPVSRSFARLSSLRRYLAGIYRADNSALSVRARRRIQRFSFNSHASSDCFHSFQQPCGRTLGHIWQRLLGMLCPHLSWATRLGLVYATQKAAFVVGT